MVSNLNEKGFAISNMIFFIVLIAIAFVVLPLLWNFFGFTPIELPSSVLNALEGFQYIVYVVRFFFPIDFACGCLIVIFTARVSSIFFGLINHTYKRITGK